MFNEKIQTILKENFLEKASIVYNNSNLLQYINIKTKSANKGSKSRSSFANLYALYVLIEDYLNHEFDKNSSYSNYEGASFSSLFERQRKLPFGDKLQNHGLNHRLNEEFKKYFPTINLVPVLRDTTTGKYWINENLLIVEVEGSEFNIANTVLEIINAYIDAKKESFSSFILACEKIQNLDNTDNHEAIEFIMSLVSLNSDARLFEIVSYSILKYFYADQTIYWGYDVNNLNLDYLQLFKTGRTNANDGGIDFVMKPLGRFFQVTETLDFKKYFLDIEKIERYPLTFVIKSDESVENILNKLKEGAKKQYVVNAIVDKYMGCIEEIINIPMIKERLEEIIQKGNINKVIEEIVIQSKVEFNINQQV